MRFVLFPKSVKKKRLVQVAREKMFARFMHHAKQVVVCQSLAADQRRIDAAYRNSGDRIAFEAYCDLHAEGRLNNGMQSGSHAREGLPLWDLRCTRVVALPETVQPIAAFPEVMELNIGHLLLERQFFAD